METEVYSSILFGTGLGLETGASGVEARDTAYPRVCYLQQDISNRKDSNKEVSYLGLGLLETGASGPETGDQARPQDPLRVIDTCEEIFSNRALQAFYGSSCRLLLQTLRIVTLPVR